MQAIASQARASSRTALLVGASPAASDLIAQHLVQSGCAVEHVDDCRAALRGVLPDVAVIAFDLSDGSGLELVLELRRRSPHTIAVLFADQPSYDDLRRTHAVGGVELLRWRATASEWELALTPAALPSGAAPAAGASDLQLGPERSEHRAALQRLLGFALAGGLDSAARARLGTAVAELLDNVRRHAGTACRLSATFGERGMEVRLQDYGAGFDAARALLAASPAQGRTESNATSSGGLARVGSLVERFGIESGPDGTLASLSIAAHAAAFEFEEDAEGHAPLDLSLTEYLEPELTARLLVDDLDAFTRAGLPPALSIVLGRLQSPRPAELLARACLWSGAR